MNKISTTWVIDDDEIYRFAIKLIMKRADITEKTLFFHNGKMAIDFFTVNLQNPNELPDLILLDLNMPVLDGWQFLDAYEKLKPQISKNITIYLVSSTIDEQDYNRAKSISCVKELIVKPLTTKDIQRILAAFNPGQ
ncbi:response regulator [Dyadobacter flavalbus]|uniref:Response regulator n=1 Tax=Dyadobacter flavalbus TaxID=2579942 RepID=A0A5M8QU77_9BACT|nr:response regulator [Dyadobacter flavalbus]KAA6439835.1 response regulator [Dyadobacter flavalbus]